MALMHRCYKLHSRLKKLRIYFNTHSTNASSRDKKISIQFSDRYITLFFLLLIHYMLVHQLNYSSVGSLSEALYVTQ